MNNQPNEGKRSYTTALPACLACLLACSNTHSVRPSKPAANAARFYFLLLKYTHIHVVSKKIVIIIFYIIFQYGVEAKFHNNTTWTTPVGSKVKLLYGGRNVFGGEVFRWRVDVGERVRAKTTHTQTVCNIEE